MTTAYMSFSELAGRLDPYELSPQPIDEDLQLNIRRALIANGISIPFFALAPEVLTTVTYSWHGFFAPASWLQFPADIANFLALSAGISAQYMLPLNAFSIAALGVVMWRSKFMTKPVKEALHWLASVALVPAALSSVIATGISVGFISNIAITVAVWLLLIILALTVLSLFFGSLAVATRA